MQISKSLRGLIGPEKVFSAVSGAPRGDSAQLHVFRTGRFGYSDPVHDLALLIVDGEDKIPTEYPANQTDITGIRATSGPTFARSQCANISAHVVVVPVKSTSGLSTALALPPTAGSDTGTVSLILPHGTADLLFEGTAGSYSQARCLFLVMGDYLQLFLMPVADRRAPVYSEKYGHRSASYNELLIRQQISYKEYETRREPRYYFRKLAGWI